MTTTVLRDGFAGVAGLPFGSRFSGARDLDSYGCIGDGATDNAAALNALPAGTLFIGRPGKTYRLNSSWHWKSGQVFWFQGDCTFYAPFVSAGQSAVVSQDDLATALSSVEMYGGTFTKDSNTRAGRIFSLHADDSVFENFLIDTFGGTSGGGGGGAMFLVGDNISVGYARARNPAQNTGCAGMRYMGGTGARFHHLDFHAGDQTFQSVPGATGINSNLDIVDCQWSQCTGISYAAQLIAAALVIQPEPTPDLTASVQVSFDRIIGASAFRAILADNQDSVGSLEVTMTNFDIDVASDPINHPAIYIRGLAGSTSGSMSGIIRNAQTTSIVKSGTVDVTTTGVTFV